MLKPAHALAGIEKRVDAAGKLSIMFAGEISYPGARLAEFQQRFFGGSQNLIRLFFANQAAVDHLLRAENQLAQRGLVLDDANVAVEIGDLRQAVVERNQVSQAIDRFQLALLHQLVGQRHAIDRSPRSYKSFMRAKMRRCFSRLKSSWFDHARHLEVNGVVQQDGAEHERSASRLEGKTFLEGQISGRHRLRILTAVAPRRRGFFLPFTCARLRS